MAGSIMHDWQQVGKAGWIGAQPLGGVDNAVLLAVGRNGDKRIEVFYIGWDCGVYHIWQSAPNGGWEAPELFGGTQTNQTGLAVGLNRNERLEIFYIDTNSALQHNWQTEANGTTGWAGEQLLAAYALQVAVGQNESGQLEVFYTGLERFALLQLANYGRRQHRMGGRATSRERP